MTSLGDQASPVTTAVVVMKNRIVKYFAIVTATGLQSFENRDLDPADRRLDGAPGTVGMEIHADRKTAKSLTRHIRRALRRRDFEGALQTLDRYLIPWLVRMAAASTGHRDRDEVIRQQMLITYDMAGDVKFPLLEN